MHRLCASKIRLEIQVKMKEIIYIKAGGDVNKRRKESVGQPMNEMWYREISKYFGITSIYKLV